MSEQSNQIRDAIAQAIGDNPVILFMKGTPEQPMCGFSARTVAALQALNAPFAAVDILPDPRIRQELSAISQWPTIPQLFVNGELVGGCDIVTEMYESGELAETLGVEQPAAPEPVEEPAVGARPDGHREPPVVARAGRLPGATVARCTHRARGSSPARSGRRRSASSSCAQAVLWTRRAARRGAHRELRRAAAGRRVDPAAVDRPRAHQHAAVGRGVVRRHRPRRDLASPRRDRRPGPAGAAHPAGGQPARHGARRAARRDRGDRPGRARAVGDPAALAVGGAAAAARPRGRRARRAGRARRSPRSSAATSAGGRCTAPRGCSSPRASCTACSTGRRSTARRSCAGATSRSAPSGWASTSTASCSRASSCRCTTTRCRRVREIDDGPGRDRDAADRPAHGVRPRPVRHGLPRGQGRLAPPSVHDLQRSARGRPPRHGQGAGRLHVAPAGARSSPACRPSSAALTGASATGGGPTARCGSPAASASRRS